MLITIVRFPKRKRVARMRKVLTNIRQDPNQAEGKVLKIKLEPFVAGKVQR